MAYRIRAGESLTEALRRIGSEQLERGVTALEATRQTFETRHEARVRLKRLRALLRLFSEGASKQSRALNREFRDIGRGLAAARSKDVLKVTARSVQDALPPELQKSAGRMFSRVLRGQVVPPETPEPVAPLTLAKRLRDCRSQFKRLQVDDDDVVLTNLKRSYRRGRAVLKALREKSSVRRWHDLRKLTKELGYQLRVIRDACPAMIGAQAAHLADLASHLGDDRDLAILEALLQQQATPPGESLQQIASMRGALEPTIIPLAESAYAERPSAFAARIGAYWDLWCRAE